MSKKEERKMRVDERAAEKRREIEERVNEIRAGMNGGKLSLEDKITLAKAEKYQLDDAIRKMENKFRKAEEFSTDEEEAQVLADRFLAQNLLCVACKKEGIMVEASHILPYLHLLKAIDPSQEIQDGQMFKMIGQLPQEAPLIGVYCRVCKEGDDGVDALLAKSEEANAHFNNGHLFHIDGFAKAWSELRVKYLNFERGKMQKRLDNAIGRGESLKDTIADLERALTKREEDSAAKQKRVEASLPHLFKPAVPA